MLSCPIGKNVEKLLPPLQINNKLIPNLNMKRTILFLLVSIFLLFSIDCTSKPRKHKSYNKRDQDFKGYWGGSLGAAIPLGNFPENTKVGLYSSLDFGYTFGNHLGIATNIFSTSQNINTVNEQSSFIKVGFLVGPSYRIKINKKLNWDIKAMTGYMVSDSVHIVLVNKPDIMGKGLAYKLGTSIRYNLKKKLYVGLNIDYLFCNPKYEGVIKDLSDVNIGMVFGWLIK